MRFRIYPDTCGWGLRRTRISVKRTQQAIKRERNKYNPLVAFNSSEDGFFEALFLLFLRVTPFTIDVQFLVFEESLSNDAIGVRIL